MPIMLLFLFCPIFAYLIGSICSAIIVSQCFSLPDPRMSGSKNPGATNIMRLSGKRYGILVLCVDLLKGLVPVILAKSLGAPAIIVSLTAFTAVLGHMYPVFFNFKGGKGVATTLGALLGFYWMLGVLVIVTWLVVASFSRYSSLASLISITLAPFYSIFFLTSFTALLPFILITCIVVYQHRHNIMRLMTGTEPKFNLRKKILAVSQPSESEATDNDK